MPAPEFSTLRLGCRPLHSTAVLLSFIAGCTSTPDGGLVDGSGGGLPGGGSGGISATGGAAFDGSGGLAAGGNGTGGSGAADSGGASATGGALPSGGTPGSGGSSGGAEGSGSAPSSGGADGGCGQGEITFVANVDDSVDESYREGLATCIAVAGALWNDLFSVPFDATLEVRVSYDSSIATANSRSMTTVAWAGGDNIYEVSAAYEIRTGEDPNGATEDIHINFGMSLTEGTYWFDPDPSARTAAIPANKVDVLSSCTHELGHAIGFSGARGSDGELPGYSFLYDEHSTAMGGYYYFTGTEAEAAYGAPVPQNEQVLEHLGNLAPGPGADLDLDLMHGTPTHYQHRYYPTDVDAGILADLGLPITGTPAAAAVCEATEGSDLQADAARADGSRANSSRANAAQTRVKALVGPKLGPTPAFVE